MLQLKQENKEINPDNIMIGNGLQNYDFNAGNGNPTFDDYKDLVDGFCMEHLMGFEVTLNLLKESRVLPRMSRFWKKSSSKINKHNITTV